MGYLIKFDDNRHVNEKSAPQLRKAVEVLSEMKKQLDKLISSDSFRGCSADSIKNYIKEVHFSLIGCIINVLQLYSSKYLLYCYEYYDYESDPHAQIPEETIDFVIEDIKNKVKSISLCCYYFSEDVRAISDVCDPEYRDLAFLTADIGSLRTDLHIYQGNIKYYEDTHKDISDMENLIKSINTSINEYDTKARNRSITYQQGDYFKSINTSNLFKDYSVAANFFLKDQDKLQARLISANEKQKKIYRQFEKEIAEERCEQGIWQSIKGGVILIVGVIAVVGSFGMATPIVAVTFAVAGTNTACYGGSEYVQGLQETYYGSIGDGYTKSVNPILDYSFGGNEKAYRMWGESNTIVAGFAIPVGSSTNVARYGGTSISRALITEVGKGTISMGAAYGTDKIMEKAGASDLERFIGSFTAAMITYGGLSKADAKFNISGVQSGLVVRDPNYLDANGDVDWKKWAPNDGRVPGTIESGQRLEKGMIIDRYGKPTGTYTSPAGVPFEQRSLPYNENSWAYHKYEVLKPIDNVTKSKIAAAFDRPGGGTQFELPQNLKRLIKEGYLKEIK